jgi:hypothetical protein
MNFLLYISLFFVQVVKPGDSVELKIDSYSLSGDILTLECSITNDTYSVRSVYFGGDWSTLPELENLTLFILENDTLALHVANPFGGYPKRGYDVIMPNNKKFIVIQIDLKRLYKLEHILFQSSPHPLTGMYSFQLVYYDRLFQKNKKVMYKAHLNGKRVKRHIPVTDTLRSNTIYIDMRKSNN